jgi:hypothetical protein
MKKILFVFSFIFLNGILFDSILSSLEARPGGGSSFRSSGGSRSSSSSYRSSGSSYRSSGGSYSGGGGGGDASPEALAAVGCSILLVLSLCFYYAYTPENMFKLSEWKMREFIWFASSLLVAAFVAKWLPDSGAFIMLFICLLFVLPFVFMFYGFKNFFGTKEVIYIAKKGKR